MEINRCDILIVDDTPENLYVLNTILSKVGYKVRLVTSAKQALSAIGNKLPDLILLDITMPDVDGYALCRELKSNPSFANIPVVFISALSDTIDKVKAFQVGGVDYVTKPFQTEEVLMRIETHLKIGALQAELLSQNEKLQYISSVDDLTGVYNRRSLVEYTEKQIEIAQDSAYTLFLALMDIDNFKKVNESFGHQQGNNVLKKIASIIKDSIKEEYFFGRYDGDELLIILPNANLNQVTDVLDRIYVSISQIDWDRKHKVTLSCGIAEYEYGDNFDTLIEKADNKLRTAKHKGRNQIQY